MTRSARSFMAVAALGLALLTGMSEAKAANDLERATALMQRQDFAAAVPLLRQLAAENSGDAQAFLGGLHLVGIGGVRQDFRLARHWFERAARNGNATAAFNLGLMSERGEDRPANLSEAANWYEKSALADFPMAMLKLGDAYRNGAGVPADLRKASHWLRLAADTGHPDAQNLLGVMIAEGETSGSPVEAYAWFKLAAGSGQHEAEENMALLRRQLSDADVAEAERRALAGRPARDR